MSETNFGFSKKLLLVLPSLLLLNFAFGTSACKPVSSQNLYWISIFFLCISLLSALFFSLYISLLSTYKRKEERFSKSPILACRIERPNWINSELISFWTPLFLEVLKKLPQSNIDLCQLQRVRLCHLPLS